MKPFFKDHLTTIYCGDSRVILKKIQKQELVLTDPPYGLGKAWKRKWHGNNGKTKMWGDIPEWDAKPIDLELFAKVISAGKKAIIWGGNMYPTVATPGWLVWDKLQKTSRAECELAWTNIGCASKVFRMTRTDSNINKVLFPKKHPNEKPIQLGLWCLKIAKPSSMIDPFIGTGNFLVAARLLKIPSIGIDINPSYCEEALCRLLDNQTKQVTKKEGFFA